MVGPGSDGVLGGREGTFNPPVSDSVPSSVAPDWIGLDSGVDGSQSEGSSPVFGVVCVGVLGPVRGGCVVCVRKSTRVSGVL